jgi:quinol-cytochrome oxidoreductase complex cytochrome b subunit
MSLMYEQTEQEKFRGRIITAVLLVFAVWLVSPFFHITRSTYAQRDILGYRLALGLLILIAFLGKWAFDFLSPQGLARKVSNVKAMALILMTLIVLGFIVYVVGQATVLYLKAAAAEQQQQQNIQY